MENIIKFINEEHKIFFDEKMGQIDPKYHDVYHKSLIYTLGVCSDTRDAFNSIFDIKSRLIKRECLLKGWQTGTSLKVVRLAFNLWNGCSKDVVVDPLEEDGYSEDDGSSGGYVVDTIFCCSFAPYFYEAIKIRYPEYTQKE